MTLIATYFGLRQIFSVFLTRLLVDSGLFVAFDFSQQILLSIVIWVVGFSFNLVCLVIFALIEISLMGILYALFCCFFLGFLLKMTI